MADNRLLNAGSWREDETGYTLTGEAVSFEEMFTPLLPSRFIQNSVELIRGTSILEPVRIEENSRIEKTAAMDKDRGEDGREDTNMCSLILDFSHTDFQKEAEILGVNHQTAYGTVSLKEHQFDLEIESPFPLLHMFDPVPVQVQSMGLHVCSSMVDSYALDTKDRISGGYLFANLSIKGVDPLCRMVCPLLHSRLNYDFTVLFESGLTIQDGIRFIQELFGISGGAAFTLPDIFRIIILKSLEISINRLFWKNSGPAVSYIGIGISTAEDWKPELPFVQLNRISAYWGIQFHRMAGRDGRGDYYLSGQIGASLRLGTAKKPLAWLQGTVYLPRYNMLFTLTDQEPPLPLDTLMQQYIGSAAGSIAGHLKAFDIRVEVCYPEKIFSAYMQINDIWEFQLGDVTITLSSIEAEIAYTQEQLAGSFNGKIILEHSDQKEAALALYAEYEDRHWLLSGGLYYGTLNLPELILGFLKKEPPAWVRNIQIELTKLWISFSTEEGHPYSIEAAIDSDWNIEVLGLRFNLGAEVHLERKKGTKQVQAPGLIRSSGTDMVYQIDICGYFKLSSFMVQVSASISTSPQELPLYRFRISYREMYLEAAVVRAGTKENPHQALSIQLGGTTLGGLIEYFVNLINPNLHYVLGAPWNILNAVELSRLELVADPTEQTIRVLYHLDLDLKFVTIEQLGLCWNYGKSGDRLDLIITGTFLGITYGEEDPLTWDVLNESAPSPSNEEGTKLKVYYVALGQHIRGNTGDLKDIGSMVERLKEEMKPAGSFSSAGQMIRALSFDENSSWIIALDFELSKLFRLKVLFNDPYVYGLSVTVQAESFKGLMLEILYKKVTENIGMFKARLLLPEKYRTFEAGAFSLTIGLIDVEIYTNGNFMIDLGFPHNQDFSDSFVIQVQLFTGEGGIYFGVLNSDTTSLVPAVTNGCFDPVAAFGIGFKIGLGRKFSFGPLKAGAALQAVALLEGVFARFLPADTSAEPAFYYRVSGVVGITGLVYVDLDLCVIQLSLRLEASAAVSFSMESCQPAKLAFTLLISASGKIKILFIKISFHFEHKLSFSFELGKASVPPWQLAASAPLSAGNGLVMSNVRQRLDWNYAGEDSADGKHNGKNAGQNQRAAVRYWDRRKERMFDSNAAKREPLLIDLKCLPVFSAAGIGIGEEEGTPKQQLAFLLFVDNPKLMEDGRLLTCAVNEESENSFNRLLELVGSWILPEPERDYIGRQELRQLLEDLEDSSAMDERFTREALEGLFAAEAVFRLSAIPKGTAPEDYDGVFFPAFPQLVLENYDGTVRSLDEYHMVDGAFREYMENYFRKLNPGQPGYKKTADLVNEPESFASLLFREYFYILARLLVQHMEELMEDFPFSYQQPWSLRRLCEECNRITTIVEYEVRLNDSLTRIAEQFALTAGEMQFLNPNLQQELVEKQPGDTISISLGMTPQAIVLRNAKLVMQGGAAYTFSGIRVRAAKGESLYEIAQAGQASLVEVLEANWDGHILQPGANLHIDGYIYENRSGLSRRELAAVFYTRFFEAENAYSAWYFDRISDLNQNRAKEGTLLYPLEYGDMDPAHTASWTLLPGDTVLYLSRYLAWMSNPDELFLQFESKLQGEVQVSVPEADLIVAEETLSLLAQRLLCDAACLSETAGRAGVLRPLAQVAVPGYVFTVPKEGCTLADAARNLGISLEEFAEEMMEEPLLLKSGTEGVLLYLPFVGAMEKTRLMEAVKRYKNTLLEGELSRFFLSGTRLPVQAGSDQLSGLFVLSGQQLEAPVAEEAGLVYHYRIIRKEGEFPWLRLFSSGVVERESGRVGRLRTQEVFAHNRALEHHFDRKFGAVYMAAEEEALDYSFTDRQLSEKYITNPLIPRIKRPLQEAAIARKLPLRINLSREVTMVSQDRQLFEVYAKNVPQEGCPASLQRAGREQTMELSGFAFGLLFPLVVRKKEGSVYEVMGTDCENRRNLLSLLNSNVCLDNVELLYASSLVDRRPEGLQGIQKEQPAVLIKKNLSRETKNVLMAERIGGQAKESSCYFADAQQSHAFLKLLWQCSTIGGEGCWLELGEVLPESLFIEEMSARIWVLALVQGERLYPFFNCVSVPAGQAALAADTYICCQTMYTTSSLIQTGYHGFEMELWAAKEEAQEESLFSIISCRLCETEAYEASTQSEPLFPEAGEEGETEVWKYARILPLLSYYRGEVRDVEGLPKRSGNPYTPVTEEAEQQPRIQLMFQDILGNMAAVSPAYQLSLPVKYTDELISPAVLPFAKPYYTVCAGQFSVTIQSQMPAEELWKSREELAGSADRFAGAYYQYLQEDVTAEIRSVLLAEPLGVDRLELAGFAAAGYLMCHCFARLSPAGIAVTEGQNTLERFSRAHAVPIEELAEENAHQQVRELFEEPVLLPEFVFFPDSYTLAKLFPVAEEELAAIMELPFNQQQNLKKGIYLHIRERQIEVENVCSFAELSEQCRASIEDLVTGNERTKGILCQNCVFLYEEFEVEVTEAEAISLLDIAYTFYYEYHISVSSLELVMHNADEPLLAQGAVLSYHTRCTKAEDTLESAAALEGMEPAELIRMNLDTEKLYAAGTSLLCAQRVLEPGNPLAQRTVSAVAGLYHITPKELFAYNAGRVLAAGAVLQSRTYLTVPEGGQLRLPYYAQKESLEQIAGKLGTSVQVLGEMNQDMPLFAGNGQVITVGQQQAVLPEERMSIREACQLFTAEVSLEQMLEAVSRRTDLLKEGALLLVPCWHLQEDSSITGLCRISGLSIRELAEANAPLQVLLPGVRVACGSQSAVTAGSDNLLVLARRLSTQEEQITPQMILEANQELVLFRRGAGLLLTVRQLEKKGPLIAQQKLDGLFALDTECRVCRNKELVHVQLQEEERMFCSKVKIPVLASKNEKGELSTEEFVRELEHALPHVRIASGGGKEHLWGLVTGDTGGHQGVEALHVRRGAVYAGAEGKKELPRYFCLRPLNTMTESRADQEIFYLEEDGNWAKEPVLLTFTGIDLEQWGRTFLEDLEQLLDASYTVPIYQRGTLHKELEQLIGCKERLAAIVSRGVDLVLEVDNRVTKEALDSVRTMLKEALRADLTAAGSIGVIAQYDIESRTQWTQELSPALSGRSVLDSEALSGQQDTVKRADISIHKISLKNGGGYANMAVSTNAPQLQKHIPLNHVVFTADQLEYDRSRQEDGYEDSAWLQFVHPFGQADGITLDFTSEIPAPVPLRLFPALPIFRGHDTRKSSEDITEGYLWDYRMSYQWEGYSQDTLLLKITLNNNVEPQCRAVNGRDLFLCLAQYMTARERMFEFLDGFQSGTKEERVEQALRSFLTAAGEIADAWEEHVAGQLSQGEARGRLEAAAWRARTELSYWLSPDLTEQEGKIQYRGIFVRLEEENRFPAPRLAAAAADGERYILTRMENSRTVFYYAFEEGHYPLVSACLDFEFVLPKLDLLKYQNAASQLQIYRNDQLLADYGIAVREAFLYKTPLVHCQSVITPMLDYTNPYKIGEWSDDPERNPMKKVVESVLKPASDMKFSLQLSAGAQVADGIYFQTPIALRITDSYSEDLVEELIAAVSAWKAEHSLTDIPRRYTVMLMLFSELDQKLPMLSVQYVMEEEKEEIYRRDG